MKSIIPKLIAAVTGVLVGIASYYLINGWYNVIPWAVAAFFVGYFSKTRSNALVNGAVFGYFLFLAYIYIGYQGKTNTPALLKFILFDVGFSIVGAVIGLLG